MLLPNDDVHPQLIQNDDMQCHTWYSCWGLDRSHFPCHFQWPWLNFLFRVFCDRWTFSAAYCTRVLLKFRSSSWLNRKSDMICLEWLQIPNRPRDLDLSSKHLLCTGNIDENEWLKFQLIWMNLIERAWAYIEWNSSVPNKRIVNALGILLDFEEIRTALHIFAQLNGSKIFLINISIQKLGQFWEITNCRWHSNYLYVGCWMNQIRTENSLDFKINDLFKWTLTFNILNFGQ